MDILTLGKIKKLKDALAASDLNTLEQIQIVNDALTQAIDVDVADALAQVASDLANTQAAVGGDLSGILTSMGTLESDTNIAIAAIPATVQAELTSLGTAGYLNVGTGANQVVQLNSSGHLPAISGQNLTGVAGGQLIHTATYTSNNTWSKPSGTTFIEVELVGGGGGGIGEGEAGGAGGYAFKRVDNPASSVSVTIGGGGDGRHYCQNAPGGGTTSFGGYVSASGGQGAHCSGHRGGHGGIGSGGDVNFRGGGGSGHGGNQSGSCAGGASYFGGAGPSGHSSSGRAYQWEGLNHNPPGSGGTGGASGHGAGADGVVGCVIVRSYK
jgi:hypothetical protein